MARSSMELSAIRSLKARRTSLMNVALQGVQVATGLISVPLTYNYLGAERFGLWMTLSAALAFIAFADFGVGIGTQDRMSRAIAVEDYDKARGFFYGTLFFVALVVLCLMILAFLVMPSLDISGYFSIESELAAMEVTPTATMVVFVFCVGLLSGIVQRAYNALQEGYLVATILLVARIISLVLLVASISFRPGLPWLVFVTGGLASLVLLCVGIPMLLARHRWMIPSFSSRRQLFDFESFKSVARIGGLGLGAALAIYLVNNSSMFIISAKYGAAEASDYAVILKMLGIPSMLVVYVMQPFWPAIADANARADYLWISSAYEKSARMLCLFALTSAAGVLLFGRQLIELWVGNDSLVPDFRLLLASVLFFMIGCWNTLLTTLLNGVSSFRSQAIMGTAIAGVSVLVACLLPANSDKSLVVVVVCSGYVLRCIWLQREVNIFLRGCRSNLA